MNYFFLTNKRNNLKKHIIKKVNPVVINKEVFDSNQIIQELLKKQFISSSSMETPSSQDLIVVNISDFLLEERSAKESYIFKPIIEEEAIAEHEEPVVSEEEAKVSEQEAKVSEEEPVVLEEEPVVSEEEAKVSEEENNTKEEFVGKHNDSMEYYDYKLIETEINGIKSLAIHNILRTRIF